MMRTWSATALSVVLLSSFGLKEIFNVVGAARTFPPVCHKDKFDEYPRNVLTFFDSFATAAAICCFVAFPETFKPRFCRKIS